MTFDQDFECRSEDEPLAVPLSPRSSDEDGGLLPNALLPYCETSGVTPFSDLVIIFPTETKPVNGHDAAFNAAALSVNPSGIICILPGYLDKAEFDFIYIEINGIRATTHTVSQEEVDENKSTVLFIESTRFIDQANNTVQAFVERLSGTTDTTKLFNFLADRELPVGIDPIPSTPYNDKMNRVRFDDPQIEAFGLITDANTGAGVLMLIDNYPLNQAEPQVQHRKEDDVIHVSIGGVIIRHTVTSFEASGDLPLQVWAYFGTWSQLTNGEHIVEWWVVDKSGNKCPGFSPPRIIELRTGSGVEPLLPEVFVAESDFDPHTGQDFINVPDLDGDATIELAIRNQGYNVNDTVILTIKGLSAEGVVTETTLSYLVLSPNLIRANIPLPLDILVPLAGGRILITYRRVRPGVADRHSRAALYNIVGEPVSHRLPPPEVQGLVNGALPEDTNPVHIVVPRYLGQNPNDRVDLIVVGYSATGTPAYAHYTEMAGSGDVHFFLDNAFFAALNGGYFVAHYLINLGNPRPASETVTVTVGDAQTALPAPTTLQAVPPDFTFNPLIHKANLNAIVHPHPAIVAGTELRLIFIGSAPGGSFTSAWFPVDKTWENTNIPFTVPRNIVLINEQGTARVYYELKPLSGPNQFSHDLAIKIGMPLTLPLPSVVQATPISGGRVELNPLHVWDPQPRTVEIRVRSDNFPRDADIKVFIGSKPGIGNPDIPARPAVPEPGENYTRFTLLSSFVAAYLGAEFTVSYNLIQPSGTTLSGALTVEVLTLPAQTLDLVSIPEASGGVIDADSANRVEIKAWPFFRPGQWVWIFLDCVVDLQLRAAGPVTPDEFNAGRTLDHIPPEYLRQLNNDGSLTVKASVSLDGTGDEATMVHFTSKTYGVRKGSGEIIREITVGNGPSAIVISRDGSTVCVTNSRTASVSVINLLNNSVRTVGGVGHYYYKLALHPTDSRLFITNYSTSGAYYPIPVLNISSFIFSYPFNHGGYTYAIALSPNGSRMFVGHLSNGTTHAIYGYDTLTNQIATYFYGTLHPRALTTNPQGTAVFSTGSATERFILSSGTRTHTIPNGGLAQELAHSPLNAPLEALYVSVSALNKIDIYRTSGDGLTFIKSLTGLSDPRGIAFHPTQPLAYVSELNGNRVRVIDTTTETLTGTINGFDQPNGVVCSPDGKTLFVCNSGNNTVAVVSI